jgi:hypothetical protein
VLGASCHFSCRDQFRAAEFFDTRGNRQRMEMLKVFVVAGRAADGGAGQHLKCSGLDVDDWSGGDADFRPNKINGYCTMSSERGIVPRALSRKADLPQRRVAGTIGVERRRRYRVRW